MHRLRSVRRVLGGLSAVKVGQLYGDSPRAVSYWVERFKARGVAGLNVSPRSGRPSKISPAQRRRVEAFVAKAREHLERVSGGILATFIKEALGVTITRRQCERILKQLKP